MGVYLRIFLWYNAKKGRFEIMCNVIIIIPFRWDVNVSMGKRRDGSFASLAF